MPRGRSEPRWVADASAILAAVNAEAGGDAAAAFLPDSIVSSVNFSEVLAKLLTYGLPQSDPLVVFVSTGATVVPFGEREAVVAAALRLPTASFGLSLGDRACIATGIASGLPVLTADRRWADANLPAEVTLIR